MVQYRNFYKHKIEAIIAMATAAREVGSAHRTDKFEMKLNHEYNKKETVVLEHFRVSIFIIKNVIYKQGPSPSPVWI